MKIGDKVVFWDQKVQREGVLERIGQNILHVAVMIEGIKVVFLLGYI